MIKDIPAFPFTADCDESKPNQLLNTGMTLRDYFASQALIGLLMKGSSVQHAVEYAYQTADQMMVRRNKDE